MKEAFEGFAYRNGELYCDDAPVAEICERYGTPLYIYSYGALTGRFRRLREAFSGADAAICYSVKSNSNIAVIRALAREGAGADIVSVGELRRALTAGVDPQKDRLCGRRQNRGGDRGGAGRRHLGVRGRVGAGSVCGRQSRRESGQARPHHAAHQSGTLTQRRINTRQQAKKASNSAWT